ncbi:PQQ-dependent catabolism-associated CXXCW motif protein [Stutzerimonas tarimensis]|uniref:PQQ-dependent catabolism-associated CXXCW motif protein n=1 Tax=Stutzerimonas tarimensis TaxID=1507735 RepID=A0ABV7T395_9GAMM
MDRPSHLLLPALAALLVATGTGVVRAAGEASLFNAEGYRQAHYRSPTPAHAVGAETLDTEGLRQLLERLPQTVLVDVYRRQWLHDRFIPDEDHRNLPGSLWLANTGDGQLVGQWSGYFSFHLEQATGHQKDWPLVFYCRSDCWLGWNAVKRAQQLGYTQLYWYRDGIDAWEQAGLPLQPAEPAALP